MVPLPEASRHSTLSLAQKGQMTRGYQCARSHAVQIGIRKRPWRAASKKVLLSAVMTGGASLRLPDTAIASLTFHDNRRAAVTRGELKARALRQRQIAALHLYGRMSFAAQLPHRFEHCGHAPAIGWMIVAQAAAVGVERQRAYAGDKIAVCDEFSAGPFGAEAEVLELHDHGDGEAIVDRGVFDIGRRHARFGKGDRAGAPCARRGEIEGAAGQVLHRFAGTDDLHGGPL